MLVKGAAVAELELFAAVRPDEMTYTFDAKAVQVTVMVEKVDATSWTRLEAARGALLPPRRARAAQRRKRGERGGGAA